MIFAYVLISEKDNGYYVGITKSVEERLKRHNSGRVISTRGRKPFKLVYTEVFDSYNSARVREIEIKSYKGGNKFKELIK